MKIGSRGRPKIPRETIVVWGAVLAYVLILSFLMRKDFVDDAYIGFRYIDNVLQGHGFVFNPPVRIEGVTNIGWLLVLTPFSVLFPVTASAKILSGLLLVAAAAATAKLSVFAFEERGRFAAPAIWPLALVANFDFLLFSSTGMETALMGFCLSGMILLAARRPTWTAAALLGAFAFLVRPESVLIFPLALALDAAFDAALWKKRALSLAVFISLIAGITILRRVYFGDFLPNTFYAKLPALDSVLENIGLFFLGAAGNIPPPFAGWIALPLWINGAVCIRRKNRTAGSFAAAVLAAGILFSLYAPQDWTALGRYFAPYLPIATLVLLCGLADVVRRLPPLFSKEGRPKLLVGLACVLLIAAGVSRTLLFLLTDERREYPGFVMTSLSLIEPSVWVRDHVPDRAVVATGRIGAISFFSEKRIFDYKYGLTERAVARLRRKLRREFVDPRDPELGDLWRAANPDYFLEDADRIASVFQLNRRTGSPIRIQGTDFRLLKTFKLGLFKDWALYERVR